MNKLIKIVSPALVLVGLLWAGFAISESIEAVDSTSYAPKQVTSTSEHLDVNVAGTSALPVYTDDAAYTAGTSKVMTAGCFATTDTMDASDTGAIRCDTSRRLMVDLAAGTGLTFAEGALGAAVLRVTLATDDDAVTSLGSLDNAVDGNYLNTNLNLAGTDAAAGEGVLGASVLRVSLATDDDAVTSLGSLDNSVDGNYLNTNLNLAGTDAAAGEGALSASTLRVSIATDDDMVTNINDMALAVFDDDIAYTVDSTDRQVVVGCVNTNDAIASGYTGALACDGNRHLEVVPQVSYGAAVIGTTVQTVTIATDDPVNDAAVEMSLAVNPDDGAPAGSGIVQQCVFDDAVPDSVDEGDAGYVRMSANRNMYMQIRDAAGNERGANVTATGFLEVDINSSQNSGAADSTTLRTITASDSPDVTSLGTLDNCVYSTGSGTPTAGFLVLGSDGTNPQALTTGAGVTTTGSVRVVMATDAPEQDALVELAGAINAASAMDTDLDTIKGTAVDVNNGTAGNGTLRVTIASDSTGVISVDDNSSSLTVDNGGTFAVQAATTIADGADVTLGAKADARSTATDATAVSIMQVLKEISYMEQTPASRAVTNAGTFAVQVDGSALTALQLIDNSIVVDDAAFTPETGSVSMAGFVYDASADEVTDHDGAAARITIDRQQLTKPTPLTYDADTKTDCVAITASDADFTLSVVSNYFSVCAYGNTAYITCADATPGVTTAVGGFSTAIADGQCKQMKIVEALCAVIGTSAAGFICFNPLSE